MAPMMKDRVEKVPACRGAGGPVSRAGGHVRAKYGRGAQAARRMRFAARREAAGCGPQIWRRRSCWDCGETERVAAGWLAERPAPRGARTVVEGGRAQHAVLVLLPLRLEAVLGGQQHEDDHREAGLRAGERRGGLSAYSAGATFKKQADLAWRWQAAAGGGGGNCGGLRLTMKMDTYLYSV